MIRRSFNVVYPLDTYAYNASLPNKITAENLSFFFAMVSGQVADLNTAILT